MNRLVFGAVLVLALAALLFWSGWFCGSKSSGDKALLEVQEGMAEMQQSIQGRMEARFDRIEGKLNGMDAKLDAILRIATNPPPDMKGGR